MRAVLLLAVVNSLFAQDTLPRLAAAGKLWARIQYTHPWLASQEIDWDNAFATAAPKILAATTPLEYQIAIEALLRPLQDPATYVRIRNQDEAVARRLPTFRREHGVVVFDPGHGYAEKLDQIASSLFEAIAEEDVRGLIIDARRSPALDDEWSDRLNPQPSPATMLVSVHWSGYPNAFVTQGHAHQQYHRSLHTTLGYAGRGRSTSKPVVVIASRLTKLPPSLISLQLSGKVRIVLEGHHAHCAVVLCQSMPLVDGVTAMIRTHEFLHPDGGYGFSPQREVAANGLDAALELLNQPLRVAALPRGFGLLPFVQKDYREETHLAEGLRLLGVLKAWSVFEYFFPYKHLIGENWDDTLLPALREVRGASDGLEYHLAIARLVARTGDSHCQVGSRELDRFWGKVSPPFSVRWVEGRPTVVSLTAEARSSGLQIGDVLLGIDGRPIQERVDELKGLLAASTAHSGDYGALLAALRVLKGQRPAVNSKRQTVPSGRSSSTGALRMLTALGQQTNQCFAKSTRRSDTSI